MPEGDTIAGHARKLRPLLLGRSITELAGTAPSLRRSAGDVRGAKVTAIRTVGKHLILDLDTGCSIRVHLGMTGRWVILDRSRVPHGSARMVLSTDTHHIACHAAPTIQVARTSVIDLEVSGLGPDLLGDFDEEEFMRRALKSADQPLSEVLLDQRVVAGVGNVYKSELLFLEGLHPDTVGSVTDEQLRVLTRRARRLLAANVGRARSTTGFRARHRDTWVYGRAGEACRRCSTPISQARRGGRVTYWCPACQPGHVDRSGGFDPPPK